MKVKTQANKTLETKLRAVANYYVPSGNADHCVLQLDRWWIQRFVKGPHVLEMGCSDGTNG